MTEPAYKGKEPLPLSVYVSARAGDPQAVERLLRYYDNYMNCLCTRTLYDEDGYPSFVRGRVHEAVFRNQVDPSYR